MSSSNSGKSISKSRTLKVEFPRLKEKNETTLSNTTNIIKYTKDVSTILVGDAWIIYYDYSYHMCFKKDWFTTYRSIDSSVFLMRNNMSCN